MKRALGILVCGFALGTCSSSAPTLDVKTVYSTQTTKITYEVDYMPGAEPYVGTAADGQPIWNFLKNNVTALFDGKKTVTVPTALSGMEEIPAGSGNYSQEKISQLADQHRNTPAISGDVASIYIIFLNGFFESNGQAETAVLGISIGNSGIIAIFKKAIEQNTFPSQRLRSFVEQSVLIHESGHSLGLVNNGVATTAAHQDTAHGAHCTNRNCVMYYLNEGVQDLLDFINRGNPSTATVIFGTECLNDTKAALSSK